MCLFITAVLPAASRIDRIPPKVRFAGIGLAEPVKNLHLRHWLPADARHVRATRAYCDCDTVLGRARSGAAAGRGVWAGGGADEAATWLDYLRAVLAVATPRISLLLHCYGGALDREPIVLKRTEVRRISAVSGEFLRQMERDVLYEFVR